MCFPSNGEDLPVESGIKNSVISSRLGVSLTTVQKAVKRRREERLVRTKLGKGRKRTVNIRRMREIVKRRIERKDDQSLNKMAEELKISRCSNGGENKLGLRKEMFLSGALDMDKETEARVLLLGLAGGYMDITVVEVDRKMVKVAKKWFGLTLDAKQHVDKYDVILVDVCAAEKEALCPLKSAINTDTAETLSSILNEEGALIVNVFSTSSGTSNVGEKVMTCIQHERPKGLEEAYSSFMKYEKPNVVLI
ncbi:hypothetical protein OESDEN_10023 [Oesophagostomum dentatum]|uniref:PABS domain-containing protein n=1 Tax=Oesophagostomum dentatum TaxID=61180 RepID=A0A0B1SY10_OESDE|nr:hypothetical protein OESDEN_10023 [Oesophagostomum dentatum]